MRGTPPPPLNTGLHVGIYEALIHNQVSGFNATKPLNLYLGYKRTNLFDGTYRLWGKPNDSEQVLVELSPFNQKWPFHVWTRTTCKSNCLCVIITLTPALAIVSMPVWWKWQVSCCAGLRSCFSTPLTQIHAVGFFKDNTKNCRIGINLIFPSGCLDCLCLQPIYFSTG